MTKKIPLANGGHAIVDHDDYAKLKDRKWHGHLVRGVRYASRKEKNNGRAHRIYMHRLVVCTGTDSRVVDHVNGNGLDNRKLNLRLCDIRQNAANMGLSKRNTTGFKGVSEENGRFRARVSSHGREYYLGHFGTAKEAARAYNKKAVELFGEYARTNNVKAEVDMHRAVKEDRIARKGMPGLSLLLGRPTAPFLRPIRKIFFILSRRGL
jgi:hypothetical protein